MCSSKFYNLAAEEMGRGGLAQCWVFICGGGGWVLFYEERVCVLRGDIDRVLMIILPLLPKWGSQVCVTVTTILLGKEPTTPAHQVLCHRRNFPESTQLSVHVAIWIQAHIVPTTTADALFKMQLMYTSSVQWKPRSQANHIQDRFQLRATWVYTYVSLSVNHIAFQKRKYMII